MVHIYIWRVQSKETSVMLNNLSGTMEEPHSAFVSPSSKKKTERTTPPPPSLSVCVLPLNVCVCVCLCRSRIAHPRHNINARKFSCDWCSDSDDNWGISLEHQLGLYILHSSRLIGVFFYVYQKPSFPNVILTGKIKSIRFTNIPLFSINVSFSNQVIYIRMNMQDDVKRCRTMEYTRETSN